MDDSYLEKEIKCPSGKQNSGNDNENVSNAVPGHLRGRRVVKYCFGDKSYYTFGNMANTMHLLQDKEAANFFFSNRYKKMNEMISQHTSLNVNQRNLNMFVTAVRIA